MKQAPGPFPCSALASKAPAPWNTVGRRYPVVQWLRWAEVLAKGHTDGACRPPMLLGVM